MKTRNSKRGIKCSKKIPLTAVFLQTKKASINFYQTKVFLRALKNNKKKSYACIK
jgi:hypothetical protein